MITAIALANTSIPSHDYHFFFVVSIFKPTLSNFEVYNTHIYIIQLCNIISYNHLTAY